MTGVGILRASGVAGTPLLFDVGNSYTGVHLIMVIKLCVCVRVVSCYFTIKRLKKSEPNTQCFGITPHVPAC